MHLESEEFVTKQLSVLQDQLFVKGIGIVSNAAGDSVNIERDVVFLYDAVKLSANSGIVIKQPLLRHGKAVLDLKSGILVDQAVLFQALETIIIVNMEEFHFSHYPSLDSLAESNW